MKKKLFHKITALTLVRRIIQILSLILFPGLFIYTFASIKAIYVGLISGSFDASVLTGQIILTVSVLLITAIMGRFFCGFLCAFGTLGDFFWYLGSKLKIKRPKIGTKFDRLLKKLKYVLLVGIVLLIWTFGLSILEGTGNPWTVFGMLTKFSGWTELDTILSVGMGLMILIAIGSLYIERFFCRYLCPLGGIFAIVSKFRLFRIRKPRAKCGSCRACTKRCGVNTSSARCRRPSASSRHSLFFFILSVSVKTARTPDHRYRRHLPYSPQDEDAPLSASPARTAARSAHTAPAAPRRSAPRCNHSARCAASAAVSHPRHPGKPASSPLAPAPQCRRPAAARRTDRCPRSPACTRARRTECRAPVTCAGTAGCVLDPALRGGAATGAAARAAALRVRRSPLPVPGADGVR